ncbi:MAG: Dna2/Cas4 domain-containing protein [Gammaproteobacteria bacterium]|nr:Dna2/Cas4 domain-containing protein [Gammaproteobacteria bacterium]
MPSSPNIHFTPYWDSPLDAVARYVVDQASQLPDLTGTVIVLSEPRAGAALRQALLQASAAKGVHALLGPQILSFEQWLSQYIASPLRVCSQQERLLMLVEALFENPALLGQANAWTLADSLLDLFDELTLNHVSLTSDAESFARRLADWYAIRRIDLQGLQHEARLVHGLWQAWHTQLQANQLIDPAAAHILALQRSAEAITQIASVHFVGIEPQHRAQREWLHKITRQPQVHLWWHGTLDLDAEPGHNRADAALLRLSDGVECKPAVIATRDAYHNAIAEMYRDDAPLRERAARLRAQYAESPLQARISIFSALNAEQEAHAIDVQCRQWLLDGKQHIAIVTDNRRLARRVRALLERAGIFLQDAAGWALSTTRAAATLEALLLCIEEDYAKDALLDLCKSPFLFPDLDREFLKNQVYRLEHDIIHNEGVTRGLAHYLDGINDRADRLREIWSVPPSTVTDLLQRLGDACQPLVQLIQKRHALSEFLHALRRVLDATGLSTSMQQDAAGLSILQTLDDMQHAAPAHQGKRHWRDFRAWLGRNLEQHYFRPPSDRSPVELLSIGQSQLQGFDGVILAAAEQEYLPGSPARSPFFNDAVRAQLGLTTREHFQQDRLRQFYRLLHSAPQILISHRAEQDGEPIAPSPWLAALTSFHQLAYQADLQANTLHALLRGGQTQVKRWDSDVLPMRQTQPQPRLQDDLIPHTITAYDYQSLLDCPYQFFASRCLKLRPPEEIREVLSKREYGERVHLCLQAFHGDVKYLPGPFTELITEQNQAAATDMLQRISDAVFNKDLKDNYTHRGWYHQWVQTIPAYIDWQRQRNLEYRVSDIEHRSETELNAQVRVKGRLDRIDKGGDGYAIVDYKSGRTPTQTDIRNGEQIQLPFYALLAQAEGMPVTQVEYLQIGSAKNFESKFPQSGEALQQLTADIRDRLQQLMQQIHAGQSLPAWENKDICKYCDMSTLCRVGGWEE